MDIQNLPLPMFFKYNYKKYPQLTPIQEKSINSGVLEGKSLLVCAPTASGKTLVATMAISNTLNKGKSLYIVPLKALANEKFKEYEKLLEKTKNKVIVSVGDIDSASPHLAKYDLLILTSEKLDSLLRHKVSWLSEVKTVIIDEIHLLNDHSRGPTLEIIITLLKSLINPQIIGLSATIGNPQDLAKWLEATLVIDDWRPVKLRKGIHHEDKVEFFS
jgi:helicase